MTDTTPVWFMDVDGVLNFFPRGTPIHKDMRMGEATPFANAGAPYAGDVMYPIKYSPSIIDRIVEMHNSGRVNVKWLTTWGHGANFGLHTLLGLPELEVVADPKDEPYRKMGWHSWWKAAAVRDYLAENSPSKIVWTDDDLGYHQNSVQDIYEIVPSCMISPQEHRGLTHEQLDLIEAFLVPSDVQMSTDSV